VQRDCHDLPFICHLQALIVSVKKVILTVQAIAPYTGSFLPIQLPIIVQHWLPVENSALHV
jgi:hypothetical protein